MFNLKFNMYSLGRLHHQDLNTEWSREFQYKICEQFSAMYYLLQSLLLLIHFGMENINLKIDINVYFSSSAIKLVARFIPYEVEYYLIVDSSEKYFWICLEHSH